MKRTFGIKPESAPTYVGWLLEDGIGFTVSFPDSLPPRVDVTIDSDDPLYFPHEEVLV